MNDKGHQKQVIGAKESTGADEFGVPNPSMHSLVQPVRVGAPLSSAMRPSIELHIDELVLHGFETTQRYAIRDTVERELMRLLTEQGAPTNLTHDVDLAHFKGGEIRVSPGSNGETIGVQLARTIYGGLKR